MKKLIFCLLILMVSLLMISACGKGSKISETHQELRRVAENINADFSAISDIMGTLVHDIVKLYEPSEIEKNLSIVNKADYTFAENGMFYRKDYDNPAKSAAVVTGFVPTDERVINIVWFTEPMEKSFISIMQQLPEVAQVYYNSKDSYNRIYPGIDLVTQVQSAIDITQYNFYYLADKEHNPEEKAVWIEEPYVDPAGRGWMISLIAPVYVNGVLEGVPGIDITIYEIIQYYLQESGHNYVILSPTGVLIFAEENIANALSMPAFENHKYIETIKTDTYRSEDYNIFNSKVASIREMAGKIYIDPDTPVSFENFNVSYTVLAAKIKETNWLILSVIRNN